MTRLAALLLVAACAPEGALPDAAPPAGVAWTAGLPSASTLPAPRGHAWKRSIVHLHSPWSHDACDGVPLPDGAPDADCLADLRAALCTTRVDVAFLTDHPAYAADQPYEDLPHPQPGDDPVAVDGAVVGTAIHCDDGHVVTWLPGIEDELMPVGLDHHVADTPEDNDAIYNTYDGATVGLLRDAGATVLVAHTEGRDLADLEALQDAGLAGVEAFNLHAMFAPDIREEDLGLDGWAWVEDIGPFVDFDGSGGGAEPDLLVLAVLQAQAPSLAAWDALLARGPMVGTAGTDAHQNVMPVDAGDGERVDSYRRMIRWFSNQLLVDGDGADAAQQALAAGRNAIVFEILGTAVDVDFALETADGVVEMGGEGPDGELIVGCPTLAPDAPRGLVDPEIAVHVLRDGQRWQEGCGRFPADGPHVYRVEVEITPYHLEPFLGDDPAPWLHAYPWIYTNAIRVGMDAG